MLDLLDPEAIAAAREVVASADLPQDHGFFVSVAHAWGTVARSLDQRLRPLLDTPVARQLPGHRPFLAAVTSKGRESTTTIKFHQDWTYTDERVHRCVFLWCPLVDVDETNGTLRVVPGSHRWTNGVRASRSLEATEHLQGEFAQRSIAVPLRAGQALAFFPSTVHGSGPNRSSSCRPALTIATAPRGTPLIHFHLSDEGDLTGYSVDEEFFTTNPYGTPPTGRATVEPWAPVTDAQTLAAAARTSRRGSERWRRRARTPADPDEPGAES